MAGIAVTSGAEALPMTAGSAHQADHAVTDSGTGAVIDRFIAVAREDCRVIGYGWMVFALLPPQINSRSCRRSPVGGRSAILYMVSLPVIPGVAGLGR
jgi:hypothetical protein